jgi:hypothetical protein
MAKEKRVRTKEQGCKQVGRGNGYHLAVWVLLEGYGAHCILNLTASLDNSLDIMKSNACYARAK